MSAPAGTRRPVPDELFGGRLRGCYLLDLEITRVVDAPTGLRSITFRSPDLVGFTWQPGQDLMLQVPGTDRAVRRRYTIRRSDPHNGTLDIEVVLHGDGPFARWASTAAAGDHVEGVGPRGTITLREGAAHHLFVGDESAIPATFAMLEALPGGSTATAVLAVDAEPADPAAPQAAAAVDLTWLRLDDVADRLQTVPLPRGTVAYLNGERTLVRQAAGLLDARGLAPDAIATKAYWRRDQPNAAHGEPTKD